MPWDIGSWELLVLAVIAIIVVGPKELPKLLRSVGQWMAKARKMARQFQRSFDELARDSELDELRKGVNELKTGGPIGEIKRELEQSVDPIKREFGDHDPTATKADPSVTDKSKPPSAPKANGQQEPPASPATETAKAETPPAEPQSDAPKAKTSA